MPNCVIGHYCNCRYNEGGKCTAPVKPEDECEHYHE